MIRTLAALVALTEGTVGCSVAVQASRDDGAQSNLGVGFVGRGVARR